MAENSTFVRKDFYIDPPGKDATPEDWQNWQKADDKKAATAKAQHTKSLKHAPVPTWLGNDEVWQSGGTLVSPGDGVHRQVNMVGFTGDPADGTVKAERVDPRPSPEDLIDIKAALTHFAVRVNKRSGNRKGKAARHRANKRREKATGK